MASSYKADSPDTPDEAPEGQVWLCPGCGRQAPRRKELRGSRCYVNSVLVYSKSVKREEGVLISAMAVNDPEAEIVW